MTRLFMTAIALGFAVNLLVTPPALTFSKTRNQTLDFGAITCGEFLKERASSPAEDANLILMWLDGYSRGVSGGTVLNWKDIEKFSADLAAYCTQKPDASVLDAAEAVGISQ
jgi:acid stress chaperone HdeB